MVEKTAASARKCVRQKHPPDASMTSATVCANNRRLMQHPRNAGAVNRLQFAMLIHVHASRASREYLAPRRLCTRLRSGACLNVDGDRPNATDDCPKSSSLIRFHSIRANNRQPAGHSFDHRVGRWREPNRTQVHPCGWPAASRPCDQGTQAGCRAARRARHALFVHQRRRTLGHAHSHNQGQSTNQRRPKSLYLSNAHRS